MLSIVLCRHLRALNSYDIRYLDIEIRFKKLMARIKPFIFNSRWPRIHHPIPACNPCIYDDNISSAPLAF